MDQIIDQPSLFEDFEVKPLTPITRRLVEVGANRMQEPPETCDYLHSVLCQVGMPRSKTPERVFERRSGNSSMILEAGRIWSRGKWVEQPLPYGTRPRLVMVHVSGEAIKRRTPEIEIGQSMAEFLQRLGIDANGGPRGGYTMFKKQMEALAACRMILGMSDNNRDITINTQPITRFEAWIQNDGNQQSMWPGVLHLSREFYDTLINHAVPLDREALGALKHSALALDIYTWLAHRLYRVRKPDGVKVSWGNLRTQFGAEYNQSKDFKKKFRIALRQVLAVYPDARIDMVPGGMILKPSKPPVPQSQVLVLGEKVPK